MDPTRLALIAAVLGDRNGPPVLDRLLTLTVDLLSMNGAGISIINDGQHRGAIAGSGPGSLAMSELQFSLGEGPCLDADRSGRPVLEPDLRESSAQWPAFAPAALATGTQAAFAFPLRVGAVRMGVLDLYRDRAGDLLGSDLRDAVVLSHVATHLLLDLEADTAPGSIPARLADVLEHRAVVHQATGMISAQLGSTIAVALSRLRAFAWSHDRSIDAVAHDVVARVLRFEPTA